MCWFDAFIFYNTITKEVLANTWITSHNYNFFFVLRTIEIQSQSNFGVYNTVLLTILCFKLDLQNLLISNCIKSFLSSTLNSFHANIPHLYISTFSELLLSSFVFLGSSRQSLWFISSVIQYTFLERKVLFFCRGFCEVYLKIIRPGTLK